MINDHIIHGCEIKGDGNGTLLEGQAIADAIKADTLAWVHLDATHPERYCRKV